MLLLISFYFNSTMSRLNRYLEKRKPKVDIDQAWSVNSSPEPSPGYPSAESVDPFATALENNTSNGLVVPSVVAPAAPTLVQERPDGCDVPRSFSVQPDVQATQSRPNLCPDVLPPANNRPRLDPEVMPTASPSPNTGARVVILSNTELACEVQPQAKPMRQHVPLSRRFVEQCEPAPTALTPPEPCAQRLPEAVRPAGIYIPGVERRPIQLPVPGPTLQNPRLATPPFVYVATAPQPISIGQPIDPYAQSLPISIGAPCYGPPFPEAYGQMHPYLMQGIHQGHLGDVEFETAYGDPYAFHQGIPSEGLSEWLAEASMGNVLASDDRPLCLDYLKGRCKQNRYKCKFAHPALDGASPAPVTPEPPSNDPSVQICEVWVLTGFCKFGSKCHYQHPPMTAPGGGVQCSPAVTKKMQEYARRVARWRESSNDDRSTEPQAQA